MRKLALALLALLLALPLCFCITVDAPPGNNSWEFNVSSGNRTEIVLIAVRIPANHSGEINLSTSLGEVIGVSSGNETGNNTDGGSGNETTNSTGNSTIPDDNNTPPILPRWVDWEYEWDFETGELGVLLSYEGAGVEDAFIRAARFDEIWRFVEEKRTDSSGRVVFNPGCGLVELTVVKPGYVASPLQLVLDCNQGSGGSGGGDPGGNETGGGEDDTRNAAGGDGSKTGSNNGNGGSGLLEAQGTNTPSTAQNNAKRTPTSCSGSFECLGDETCVGGECRLLTGACGYAENHAWVNYQCCRDSDCVSGKTCFEHACLEPALVGDRLELEPGSIEQEPGYSIPGLSALFGDSSLMNYVLFLVALALLVMGAFLYLTREKKSWHYR